ncbi:MAG: MoxR family ATPase [Spirochaetales bacterium]|nr:MoxR family ATPase [Spirochaetales bacterium]
MSSEIIKEFSIEDVSGIFSSLREELSKVIMGQDAVIDNVLTALFAGGHILIEGVPGLGKTLLASSLSYIVDGEYRRVQFTPDLMPSDITGTTVYNSEMNNFTVKKGPVFSNLLLADEINRAPAKTQSALLQAMQEKHVTIDGIDYPLDSFFICFATQNPIEMEGTYPLPEAQVDRFFMKVLIEYPSLEDERNILKNYRKGFTSENIETAGLKKVISREDIGKIRDVLNRITVDDRILDYITNLVAATRNYPGIDVGASPRGTVDLFKASRVLAVTSGRDYVIPDDVKEAAVPVLRHRLILDVEAEIDGIKSDDFLKKIIDEVEVPR